MAITTIGFAGPVDEVQAGLMIPTGATYHVEQGAWVPTINATLDRTVTVGAGVGRARFLRTTITDPTNVQFLPQASGSRWDLLVMRHTYSPPGGASAFAVIPGNATQTSAFAGLNRLTTPDSRIDDHPIALVQITAGSQAPTGLVDLRTYYANGSLVARNELCLQFLDTLGTQTVIGSTLWSRGLDGSGVPVWMQTPLLPPRQTWYQVVSIGDTRPVAPSGVVLTWNSGATLLPAGNWSVTVEAIVKRTDTGIGAVAARDIVVVGGDRPIYDQQSDLGAPGAVGFTRRTVAALQHHLSSPSSVSGYFMISTAGVGLEYKYARVTYAYAGQSQVGENV